VVRFFFADGCDRSFLMRKSILGDFNQCSCTKIGDLPISDSGRCQRKRPARAVSQAQRSERVGGGIANSVRGVANCAVIRNLIYVRSQLSCKTLLCSVSTLRSRISAYR
jgi:hypothetical protein